MYTRIVLVAATLLTCPAGLAAQASGRETEVEDRSRPNFVFILVDDLRYDALSCTGSRIVKTPQIDRIASAGVRFTNAFATTSLCSPSRASFLTGMYAHAHGVRDNDTELDPKWPTFPRVLREHGYATAYIGKWHMGMDDQPRPGFDYWLSFKGQGEYYDPQLNENGRRFQARGYTTDILTQYAVDYITQDRDRPFCLYLSHKAVHADFIPAKRHENLLADFDFPEPANYRDDYAGKPEWQRVVRIRGGRLRRPAPPTIPKTLEVKPWTDEQSRLKRRLDYYRTLASVDESVGRVLGALKETGRLANTVVVFAGDNGFFQGEHNGLTDKRWAYEESIRIPLLAAGPGIPRGRQIDAMVLNLDLAPTFLDLAGAPIPPSVQGRSLRPLLESREVAWRTSFLYEYFREDWLPGVPDILGVRTQEWKYVTYPGLEDTAELYDLRTDALELRNLADDPAARDQLARMQAELDRLCRETGRK
ncbi:MAG TPA: sulfatase [Phycisphaerae bacterium]|nr:sulfatase [Phycisphaerae bacterium]